MNKKIKRLKRELKKAEKIRKDLNSLVGEKVKLIISEDYGEFSIY